ncbi:MAG: glycosyltransferase [Nevskiales bacterium]|nr:glycosyltransferase [Nevskiales bacterium]
MKIYQIIQGMSNVSAGPSYSVGALSHHLAARGNEVAIMALGTPPTEWPFDARLEMLDGGCERIGLAGRRTVRRFQAMAREPAILHGHSVWRTANLFPLLLDADSPARIVWSPRGTFSEWSWRYRAAVKRPFWHLLQRPALARVACFHATSTAEYEAIRRRGFVTPVAVVPNGVDIPPVPSTQTRRKRIVFLGRLHSVKGIDLLLAAWRALSETFREWELVIAGPHDSAYAHKLLHTATQGAQLRVSFPGETTGERKRALLSEAAVFVLPSHSENFAMVVAEALAHGTPVITTTGTPWREVVTRRCGWYIEPSAADLRETLNEALSLPLDELASMGRRGRDWMIAHYSWTHLAAHMNDVYRWALKGGTRPACVIAD